MPLFETERRGRVLVVRVDHPPHNFMTAGMVRELGDLFSSLRGDRSVGAVVITGKPERLYITHYDVGEILASVERAGIAAPPWLTAIVLRIAGALRRVPVVRDLAERTPLAAVFELYRIHALFLSMDRSEKVFIAAINGPATGGGCETSLACDLRVMADADIAIGQPEMTLDFNPGAGGTQRRPRLAGVGRCLAMMLEGRTLSPREALDYGLVRGGPARAGGGRRGSDRRAAPRRSPEAIRSLKRAVYEGASRPLHRGLAEERKWFMVSSATESSKEKMAAMTRQVEVDGRSPWVTSESLEPWQEGTAVSSDGERRAG
jgi:enoyl-CoA hydratase/carnithine racemase